MNENTNKTQQWPTIKPFIPIGADNYVNAQEVMMALNHWGQVIGQNNALLLENVNQLTLKNERANRKQKRKRISEELWVSEGAFLQILYFYDDETSEAKVLTKSLTGQFQIYNLEFDGREIDGKFGIWFARENCFIIGNKKKVRGDYLYQCFLRAGVIFEPYVPVTIIVKSIYRFFAPKIENTRSKLHVPSLAGWCGKSFLHAGNFYWKKTTEFPDLPVLHKNFCEEPLTAQRRELYFRCINRIKRLQDRILLMLFPFAGMLTTMLKNAGYAVPFYLNILQMEEIRWQEICNLLQIYNRQNLVPYSMDISQKEVEKMLAETCDEVLILDTIYAEEDVHYYKKKLVSNGQKIANFLTGKTGTRLGRCDDAGNAVVVIGGSKQNFGTNCYTIFYDDEFWCDNADVIESGDSVGAVFRGFVEFVERNYDKVLQKIRKERGQSDQRILILEIVFDILAEFWQEEGVDLIEAAKLPPKYPLQQVSFTGAEDDEVISAFVLAVRSQIDRFKVREKTCKYEKYSIYIDGEYLCFPTNVFKKILANRCMYDQKSQILFALNQAGFLRKDREGYSRKLCIDGIRFETYQVRREIFERLGEPSIVDLGKED